jgi:lipoprotein-releasing system permease protein
MIMLRYLRSKRLVIFSIAGVAVGVMALIVVLSVMQGFSRELRASIRGMLSDMVILHTDIRGFENYEEVMKIAEEETPHIEAAAPYLESLALMRVKAGDQPVSKMCWFRGVVPEREERVRKFRRFLQNKKDDNPVDFKLWGVEPPHAGIIGGQMLLSYPDVPLGGRIILMVPSLEEGSSSISEYNKSPLIVADKFNSGMYEFDSQYLFMSLETAQKLTYASGRVTGISLRLDDYRNAYIARDALQRRLNQYDPSGMFVVRTWEELRGGFLRAVKLETILQAIIMSVVLLVAAFSIVAILTMIVIQKTRDIGILKSLGASDTGILSIFISYGLVIGTMGSFVGLGLGLLVLWRLDWIQDTVEHFTRFNPFPAELYYFYRIPRIINPLTIGVIMLSAIGLSIVASIYPALRAARQDPVEALRYE